MGQFKDICRTSIHENWKSLGKDLEKNKDRHKSQKTKDLLKNRKEFER